MKAHLLFPDQDFDLQQPSPVNESNLIQDLELNVLFTTMSQGDKFIQDVVKKAILLGADQDAILYRQEVLKDCLKNPAILRKLYAIPVACAETKKKRWLGFFNRIPSGVLYGALELMDLFVDLLRQLREIADENMDKFDSVGFKRFFSMLQSELSDDYFATIDFHLRELRFRNGVLISTSLGQGNEPESYTLRKPIGRNPNWLKDLFSKKGPSYTFYIHERDEHGARALSDIRNKGILRVANALARSADHIDQFFAMLRVELAFYIGCLNLHEQLTALDCPVTFPVPHAANQRVHSFKALYDVCLALTMRQKVIGNDLSANDKQQIIITGANQGGKSTFLRAIGISQLMMQAGMFVPAQEFQANLCNGVFTHYKREEDNSMKSGKLDEELARMNDIADHIRTDSLLLLNESFAATNDREGSEIARQITRAMVDKHVKVFFVTHLYDFAQKLSQAARPDTLFLRAERRSDGTRTFRLFEGQPLQTSYGADVYNAIFKK